MTRLSWLELLPWLPAAVAMVGAAACWRCVRACAAHLRAVQDAIAGFFDDLGKRGGS